MLSASNAAKLRTALQEIVAVLDQAGVVDADELEGESSDAAKSLDQLARQFVAKSIASPDADVDRALATIAASAGLRGHR